MYRVVGLSTASRKIIEQILLESIYEHMKGNKMIENSYNGIINDKTCLTNPVAFYKWLPLLPREVQGMLLEINFSKFSEEFFRSILVEKSGIDKL